MRRVVACLVALLTATRVAGQTPVTQVGALSKPATLQSAATANSNGTALAIDGYATLTLTLTCSSCSGGTTVTFEISEDGTNYTAQLARLAGTTTIATSTTTAGVTVWTLPTSGFKLARARISSYSAGTVTVTGHAVAVGSDQAVVNVGNIPHVIVDTAPTTAVTGPLTDTQLRATAVPVSGTVTTSPPSNASTNLAQVGGSSVSLGQQLAAASIPVILPAATVTTLTPPAAISGFALEAGHLATIDTNAATLAGAVSSAVVQENLKQVNGVTTSTGAGAAGTGSQRLVVAQDSTTVAGSSALPAGTNVIGHVIADSGSTTAVTGSVAVTNTGLTDLDATVVATGTTAPTKGQGILGKTNDGTPQYQFLPEGAAGRSVIVEGVSGGTAVPVSGTVTTSPPSNASTNVAQFGGSSVTLGQQTAANSMPVILPSATVTTLTPPAAITNFANETGGNLATVASAVRAEDTASADADKGIGLLAIRKATPANTSGTDGDYEYLQMSAGRLWVDASGRTLTVDGSGVTQPISAAALPLPTLAATSTKQSDGTQKTQIVDGGGTALTFTGTNANVQCANCSGSGASATDAAAFTAGGSVFAPAGGEYNATPQSLPSGTQGMIALTQTRGQQVAFYDPNGYAQGTRANPLFVAQLPALNAPPASMRLVNPLGAPLGTPGSPMAVSLASDTAGCAGSSVRVTGNAAINVATATTTRLIIGSTAATTYICAADLVVAAADNVALV